ncbi:hypothetical protein D7Z54_25855 [Salibacterium salarium]|uniref:Uncharacterized protein n=1 Tax=Salibacterium salarium TaxID=284579 RepID=A0A3R9QHA2_9BACI|nr:hypothetical protein [Salibacterium salarium]RSL30525.1 hypothetical protein D7Z54_25855 [Salibacterium salarium]
MITNRKTNWIIAFFVSITFFSALYVPLSETSAGGQSRVEFQWSFLPIVALAFLIILSALLTIKRKQWYPYSIPFAIILGGLYYQFFYYFYCRLDRLKGTIGLAIALITGIILTMYYLGSNYVKRN